MNPELKRIDEIKYSLIKKSIEIYLKNEQFDIKEIIHDLNQEIALYFRFLEKKNMLHEYSE